MNKRNENRPGYKKTKVGWIPLDWSCESLLRTGAWKGGGTPSKNNANYWDNGTIPWASSQDVKSDVLESTIHLISAAAVTESSTNIIPPNSLIMVTRSGILRHTVPISKTIFDVAINQDIKALLIKEGIHCDFIKAVLQFNGKDILRKCAKVGTTVESIEFESLKKYPIPLPNFVEQKNIAEILSAWDRAIEQTRKLIAANKLLKKGLMQQLLTGRMRFPEFESTAAIRDEGHLTKRAGWIPADREVHRLADVAIINPDTLTDATTSDHSFYYINISAVKEGALCIPREKITFGNAPSRARRKLMRNDILLSMVRPYLQGFAIIDFDSSEFICSTGFAVIRASKRSDACYIYHYLFSHEASKHFYGCLVGSGYPAINNSDVEHLKIPWPQQSERSKIAELLSSCDQEISLLNSQVAAISEQKKGLMQKLLTGEVRVQLPEKAAS